MVEDEQRLLYAEPMTMPEFAATSSAAKTARPKIRNKKSTGLMPFVRCKWSRVIRSLAGSTSRLRHKIKPSRRVALCMPKLCKSSSSKRRSRGKPHACPLNVSLETSHPRGNGRSCPSHHMNDHLLSGQMDDQDGEDCGFNSVHPKHCNIFSRTHGNRILHPKVHLTRNHMLLPRKPKLLEAHDHHSKHHIKGRQHHMNGALASFGSHKNAIPRDVPKGCIGVYVGVDHTRFVVPIPHLNHPLFASLLERVDDIDGFFQPGPLWIPCDAIEFQMRQSQLRQLSKKNH